MPPCQVVSIVPREIDEHDIRLLLHALEDDLTAIWRNVEIPNVEVGRQVSQLALTRGSCRAARPRRPHDVLRARSRGLR